MTYKVIWTESSFRKLQKLENRVRKRIVEKLEGIVEDPFAEAKRLSGANLYSIGAGDHRLIVSIEGRRMVILVIDAGHRSKIYKKL